MIAASLMMTVLLLLVSNVIFIVSIHTHWLTTTAYMTIVMVVMMMMCEIWIMIFTVNSLICSRHIWNIPRICPLLMIVYTEQMQVMIIRG